MAAFDLRRATRDIDLLALVIDNEPEAVGQLVVEVASIPIDDGLVFLPETVSADIIRDDDIYPGVRVVLDARLATAQLKFSVDLNVGDPVVPEPNPTWIPLLLGDDPIEVLAYPKAMVVAEKLVTALQRGRASTRWRDFADLFLLMPGNISDIDVVSALRAVARHRGTKLVPIGEVLTGMPEEAQARWATWRARQGAQERVPESFAAVLDAIERNSRPWLLAAAGGDPLEG